MTAITYVEPNGTFHRVDIQPGLSLMEGALYNGVPGIAAQCGGACACATCHIYVPDGCEAIGERSDDEAAMLEFAMGVRANSRLACQVRVVDEMDGLIVHLPEVAV